MKHFVKLERMPTTLTVKFGCEFFFLGGGGRLKPWREKRPKNSQEKFTDEFAEKTAGKFPNIRQTRKNSPPICSAEPRDQTPQKILSNDLDQAPDLVRKNLGQDDAMKESGKNLVTSTT